MSPIVISGMLGQWIGVGCIVFGLVYEKKYKAHWGFVAITAGSMIFALATKIIGW